jgi:hypothetical protein
MNSSKRNLNGNYKLLKDLAVAQGALPSAQFLLRRFGKALRPPALRFAQSRSILTTRESKHLIKLNFYIADTIFEIQVP